MCKQVVHSADTAPAWPHPSHPRQQRLLPPPRYPLRSYCILTFTLAANHSADLQPSPSLKLRRMWHRCARPPCLTSPLVAGIGRRWGVRPEGISLGPRLTTRDNVLSVLLFARPRCACPRHLLACLMCVPAERHLRGLGEARAKGPVGLCPFPTA